MFDDLTNNSYLSNEEALSELKETSGIFEKVYYFFGLIIMWGAAMGFPGIIVSWLVLFPISLILNHCQKIYRLIEATEALLEEFGDDVIVIPRVPVPGKQSIDLFVRFPGRVLLLMSIRSKGKKKAVFNEKKGILYVRQKRENGGLTKWKPDPLAELASYEYWLKKNRRELGLSSRESSRPIAKVLVLAGDTDIEVHSKHLYTKMEEREFLWIKTKGTAALIRKEEIVDFTKAYLAQEEQKRLQKANLK